MAVAPELSNQLAVQLVSGGAAGDVSSPPKRPPPKKEFAITSERRRLQLMQTVPEREGESSVLLVKSVYGKVRRLTCRSFLRL